MKPLKISETAKRMEVCHRTAIRRVLAWQSRYPDLDIVKTTGKRTNGRTTLYSVNAAGLREAMRRERSNGNDDLAEQVGLLRADVSVVQRKIRKIEHCVFGMKQAAKPE